MYRLFTLACSGRGVELYDPSKRTVSIRNNMFIIIKHTLSLYLHKSRWSRWRDANHHHHRRPYEPNPMVVVVLSVVKKQNNVTARRGRVHLSNEPREHDATLSLSLEMQ